MIITKSRRAALKKGDIIIVAAAVLLAIVLWLAVLIWSSGMGTHELIAEIYMDGQLAHTITLTGEEQELRLESAAGYNVLQFGPQGARMLEADCQNQDCVRVGLQNRPGGVIACLPHRLLICLSGGRGAEFDAITR